jgi:hypothetical protein
MKLFSWNISINGFGSWILRSAKFLDGRKLEGTDIDFRR